MSARERLSELADRKRLLILEADLHRALLRTEAARARAWLEWLGLARGKLHASRWWLAGGALAGLLAARHRRTLLKWLPIALAAWRWFSRRQPA